MGTAQTIALVSLTISLVSLVLSFAVFLWTRKQKRVDALSEILREYISGLRQLTDANKARHSAETLRQSFPEGGTHGAALARANDLVKQYNSLIKAAHDTCHRLEIEVAANAPKFPDNIQSQISFAKDDLFRLGQSIDAGSFDASDILIASAKQRYKAITDLARGWRLRNPFKVMIGTPKQDALQEVRKRTAPSENDYDISPARMQLIMDLLTKRSTSQRGRAFAVHAPRQVIDKPDLLHSPINMDRLRDLRFRVVFQDGQAEELAFHELMVLTHLMIFAAVQERDLEAKLPKGPFADFTVTLRTTISPKDIMQPATVEALLSKIEFSSIPA